MPGEPGQIGAPMTGTILKIMVDEGSKVLKGTPLAALSAMKMEMVITAPIKGHVKKILVAPKTALQVDDLIMILE